MSRGIRCPQCGGDESGVRDVRPHHNTEREGLHRRRACLSCGHRFTTRETVEGSDTVIRWLARVLDYLHPTDRASLLRYAALLKKANAPRAAAAVDLANPSPPNSVFEGE